MTLPYQQTHLVNYCLSIVFALFVRYGSGWFLLNTVLNKKHENNYLLVPSGTPLYSMQKGERNSQVLKKVSKKSCILNKSLEPGHAFD
jgi:hypothetical protein